MNFTFLNCTIDYHLSAALRTATDYVNHKITAAPGFRPKTIFPKKKALCAKITKLKYDVRNVNELTSTFNTLY